MKLKTIAGRSRSQGRVRRLRAARKQKPRPIQPQTSVRVWSLLLPPEYPDRR